ncbi:sigma-70 family RNA polymerase sigma factor [Cellulomonas humilata]|uniref:Sigma-70 family RNA polymerase sigma factor n=1 Tax=Cellulomonas humilata TaxID=144055 RepID=A0A7Y6A499_9CELL|nr:sigma-70 family RNA polymerase sigma factor [Cellulomonas humilata]
MSASTQLDSGVTGDAELIVSARSGDAAAIGALYERHAGAAWVVARQYTDSPADADDVVADSFAAVFGALQRGNGPESAFRAYLFTVVRRVAAVRREKARRVQPTDDLAVLEAGTAWAGTADEPALAGFERGVVARAFHTLPERWQAVLWHTEVEGLSPAEIAPVLGLTANGVAALAYRAREGLRQAYLQQHLQDPLDEGCRSVAGKLGAYVRGGLGTRETGQVEAHLEDCGTCRGLLLELGDVNHGMRAVIAPLVLGLVGIGALGVLLPVGGGLAAGAAAAAGVTAGTAGAGTAGAGGAGAGTAGAGGAGAGAGGAAGATGATAAVASTGSVGAGAAATGAVGVVGAGAAGGAAAAGGVAAFLASIPLGAAAITVGSVALAAVAAISVATLLSSPEGSTATAPTTSPSATPSTPTPEPTSTADDAPSTRPTDVPTPEPTELLPDEIVLDDDDEAVDPDTSLTAEAPTDPADTTPPADPAEPADPLAATPADVGVELPTGGLALEAGLGGQELAVVVRNNGGTAATDLVAEVTLPEGVTLDGVAAAAFTGLAAGRFAAPSSAGWVCVDAGGTNVAQCTLDSLPPRSTSNLLLRVSIDESYDRSDGEIGLRVLGTGIEYVAPPIRLLIAASPARLTLRTAPGTIPLVTGRTRQLDLPVANVGGTGLGAGAGSVSVFLPAGVSGAVAPGSAWSCTGAGPMTCVPGAVGPRADAPLSLLLSAGAADVVTARSLVLQLAPSGRLTSETVTVPFSLQRPAALAVNGPGSAAVALGSPATVPVSISNTGDLPAENVQVTLTRPGTLGFGRPAVADGAWSCPGDGPTVVCTLARIDPGATVDLPLAVEAVPGAFPVGETVTVSAQAPDADPATPLAVAVEVLGPVLGLDGYDPHVQLRPDGTGTAWFTVSSSVADAATPVATLSLPVHLKAALDDPGPQTSGCTASPNRRTVTCQLTTVQAGTSQQVLVNLRWAGSAKGDASVVVSAPGAADARADRAVQTSSAGLTARDTFSGADVTEIGAPLLTCGAAVPECASALANGDRDNNAFAMVALDEAPLAPKSPRSAVPVSSTARLDVPAGREIVFAGLYWSANRAAGDDWSTDLRSARLRGPGGTYEKVSGDPVAQPTDNSNRQYYQSFADVTDVVARGGSGDWSVADVAVGTGSTDKDRTYYAGWSLVVVFSDPGSDASVTVYDGGQWIGTTASPPAFEFAAEAGTTARIGVVAWEGDRTGTGDQLLLGDTCLGSGSGGAVTRQLVPTRVGGSGSNAFDSTATGWRAANSLGTDAKAFREVTLACDVSTLRGTTAGDQYLIGAITLRSAPSVG